MNMPGPVAKKSFTTHVKAIARVSQQVAEAKMQKAVKEVRALNNAEEDNVVDIAVSCDGHLGQERLSVLVWIGFCQ